MQPHNPAIARRQLSAILGLFLMTFTFPSFAGHHQEQAQTPSVDWSQAPILVNVKTEASEPVTGIAQDDQYTVLHFLLKTECPICLRHTHSYYRAEMNMPKVKNVFIKPDSLDEIRGWLKDASADAPTIHQDPDAALAAFAGIPDGYRFHGETVHYPALIVLDPAGQEVFRHIGQRTQDRFPLKAFKEAFPEFTAAPAVTPGPRPGPRPGNHPQG